MNNLRKFWRSSFFLILLAALCGSFVFPVNYVPVNAAPQMQAASDLVISEFRFRGDGGASDEFVEIYNPTNSSVDLNGWKLNGSNSAGSTSTRYTFSTSVLLQPGRHYLLANNTTVDGVTADATYGTGITSDGGIALLRPDNSIADAAGLSAGSTYSEGTFLPELTTDADQSYEREIGGSAGNCSDTNNNTNDFIQTSSNPQNSSSAAIRCMAITNVTSSVTDGVKTTGTIIDIIVTFTDVVNVDLTGGTPTLDLETGATDSIATYTSGSGSNTLTFLYTVALGNTSNDLDYVSTTALRLNGGTIIDAVGDVNLTLPAPGSAGSLGANKNIVIDNGAAPTVTVNQAAGQIDPTGALPINFAVQFSEAIDPNSFTIPSDVTQNGTATGITWTILPSVDNINFTLRATAVTAAGTLIPLIPAGAVQDLAGNGNTASTSTDNSVTYAPATALSVIINEVAWSGTAAQTNDEWIELRNPGTVDIDITGWQLYGDNNVSGQVNTPNIILSGTIPAGGLFLLEREEAATSAPANQINSSIDLLNTGERLYLKDTAGTTIDTANVDGGSWPAGTSTVTGTTPLSYASMERVEYANQWVTYAGTVPIANDRNGNPIKGTPGGQNWIRTATVTTITADTPDPSVVNQNVTVSVTVVGGTSIPTGTVAITGANTNCTITLTNGSGSCTTVKFTSTGTKTLTATYSGDASHPASNDTETHTVSSTTTIRTPTPTRVPTLAPPPPLVAINEFVPRPGHDWNNDGEVNVLDEYIEIINHGTINVNLSGYSLDDEANIGSSPYRLPSVTIVPGERIVFYASETGLLLSDGGDGVRLLKANGQLADAYNYTVARYPDQSYCRLPDNGGLDDWNQNCFPTPGLQNSLSGDFVAAPVGTDTTLLCPIADTLPEDFVIAECAPYGNNIWRRAFWDQTGWYGEKVIPNIHSRWDVFAD